MRRPPGREFDKARPWVAWGGYRGPHGSAPRRFRWVELALGIVLAAVLYAIFWPVSCDWHPEKPHQASCSSNEKQLALAMLMYAQDYGDRFPSASRGAGEHRYTWRLMLYAYAKSDGVFFCSNDPEPEPNRWRPALYTFAERHGSAGYGANMLHASGSAPTSPMVGGVRLERVRDSARTIMLAESSGLSVIRGLGAGHLPAGKLWAPSLVLTRHNDGANYAFSDGHVKWMMPKQVQCGSGGGKDGCPWSVE